MRIWHAFDTKHKRKTIAKLKDSYPDEKIFVVIKSPTHKFFYHILPYLFLYLATWALFFWVIKYLWLKSWVWMGAFIWLVVLLVFWLLYQQYQLFVRHYGDYIIVTPDMLSIYNQWGLLNRTCKTIYIKNIAWIYVDKDGFLNSMMNEGSITIEEFGTETDDTIAFWPVSNPDVVKENIERVITMEGNLQNNDYHPSKRR